MVTTMVITLDVLSTPLPSMATMCFMDQATTRAAHTTVIGLVPIDGIATGGLMNTMVDAASWKVPEEDMREETTTDMFQDPNIVIQMESDLHIVTWYMLTVIQLFLIWKVKDCLRSFIQYL